MAHGGSWKTKRIGAGFLRALMCVYIYMYIYIYIYTHGITQFIAALIGKVMISHHIAAFPLRFSWALSCPLLGTLWPIPETIAGAIHPDAGAIRQEEMDPRFLFDTWDTKILWVCIQCSIYIYIYIYWDIYRVSVHNTIHYIYIYNVMQFKSLC